MQAQINNLERYNIGLSDKPDATSQFAPIFDMVGATSDNSNTGSARCGPNKNNTVKLDAALKAVHAMSCKPGERAIVKSIVRALCLAVRFVEHVPMFCLPVYTPLAVILPTRTSTEISRKEAYNLDEEFVSRIRRKQFVPFIDNPIALFYDNQYISYVYS